MSDGVEEEKSLRKSDEELQWPAKHAPAGCLHCIEYEQPQINGNHYFYAFTQYDQLKEAVTVQKQAIKNVDLDKMEDMRDEMLDIKMQSDMMNDIMNRNYDMDYDEDEFEDDFMEFEKQIAAEKKQVANKQQQQQINKAPGNKNNMNLDDYI